MSPEERKLLERVLGRSTDSTNPESVDEFLKLNNLLSNIKQLELDEVQRTVDRSKSEIDRLVEQLRSDDRKIKRIVKKKKKPGPKKMHWRTRRKHLLEYRRTRGYARDKALLSSKIEKGGWYEAYVARWKRRGSKRLRSSEILTRKEWDTYIEPLLGPQVQPLVKRGDPNLGFRLDNILVFDRKSGALLFDGLSHKLSTLDSVLTDE